LGGPDHLELVGRIVEQASALHLLVLLTARPEFSAPWPNHRHLSAMALSRLDRAEGERLVEGLTGGKALPAEVLQQIVARTDGVPLFIEELTKTVLESGLLREMDGSYELAAPLPPLAIPSTLHASLLARLDRLASVKDLAQIGAAIGREFSYRLLAPVAGLGERELRAALARLVEAGLLFQRGEPPEAMYVFKHALVQERPTRAW
jgi:predicted ATPase